MKLKLSLLMLLAFMPLFVLAQGGSVTIFSEDGDKFVLYLNGLPQNSIPQVNLRLDGLTQPYYKAKIVFDDKAKAAIDKNIAVTDATTNQPADVVYKIKNKGGDMKLRFFSAQPVQPNYAPSADVYVVHYGQQDQATSITQTTTTTSNSGNGSVSFGMNTGNGGVSMSVNRTDPNGGVTQTTTTTTSSTTTTTGNSGYTRAQPPAGDCQYPMDAGNFKAAKKTVEQASFEDTKLSSAKAILAANCFSTDQVMQVCNLFGFEATKLNFAKFAYGRTTDPGNYFKVANIFSFDGSKTDLNNFIANGGR